MIRELLQRPWVAGLLCLGVVLFFHSPRWWIIARETPGSVEWDRGSTYLKQCESPFRDDIEPATRWRFVPQVLVRALGGNRAVAFAIPWLGAWALLAWLYGLSRSRGLDEATSTCVTLLVGASVPVLVSTGWLGMNDAWVGLGLCYVALGRRLPLVVLACIVCPFIDERFVFGAPLALVIRNLEAHGKWSGRLFVRWAAQCLLAIGPYAAIRILAILPGRDPGGEGQFLLSNVRESSGYLWMAPLGAWMAFRFAYMPILQRTASLLAGDRLAAWLLILAAVVPVSVGFLVASDTMRTAGILLPLCAWSAIDLGKTDERKQLMWLAIATLVFTAAHVSHTKVFPINSLPVEIWRVLR